MQKYEIGKDCFAASNVQMLATASGVYPGSFFDEDVSVPAGNVELVREASAVAVDWQRIKNPVKRKGLATLLATPAAESQVEPESEG